MIIYKQTQVPYNVYNILYTMLRSYSYRKSWKNDWKIQNVQYVVYVNCLGIIRKKYGAFK